MTQYLAIDIGGTVIKASLMNESYEFIRSSSEATLRDPEAFLNQLRQMVREYTEADRISGIALCIAGFINPQTGENTDYSVGENFRRYNLKRVLEQEFALPVLIENDSNCAAIGEHVAGVARDYQNFCLLTIGTGIGGAIVINDSLYRGSHYKAGEAGLTLLRGSVSSGSKDAEEIGATSVLVRRVSQILEQQIDGRYIFAHLNDDRVDRIYREWLDSIACLAGNTATLLDSEAVLIGGGISEEPIFIRDLTQKIDQIFPKLTQYTRILACKRGNDAGKIGALHLLLEQRKKVN